MSFLSVNDLRARWSCSRAFVYRAIGEMDRGGYLRRIYIGADQRLAVESVVTWERLHASAPGAERAPVVTMRKKAARKSAASTRATAPATSLREQWRRMRSAA